MRNFDLKPLYCFIVAACVVFWLLPVPRPEGPLSTVVLDREGMSQLCPAGMCNSIDRYV